VLIGQVVALTLNICVSPGCVEDAEDLAAWILPAEFCTVPYDDPEGCPKHYTIPADLVGKTVQELLAAANAALAGNTTYSLKRYLHGCNGDQRRLRRVPERCPLPRGDLRQRCDDDFDGLTDGDDPDCGFLIRTCPIAGPI
jgi:hypothetical protein